MIISQKQERWLEGLPRKEIAQKGKKNLEVKEMSCDVENEKIKNEIFVAESKIKILIKVKNTTGPIFNDNDDKKYCTRDYSS